MQWQEQSIILSTKPFAENKRLVTVFNRSLGKTTGLIAGTKQIVQSGDISDVIWKGRNIGSLGTFKIETVFSAFPFIYNSNLEVLALDSACTLCNNGLPSKAPHERLFDLLKQFLLDIVNENWLLKYVLFEKEFLSEVGIGLSLSECAITKQKTNLFYISPRTGKAVTEQAGEPYKEKLFILPQFFIDESIVPSRNEILSALKITQHFLIKYFLDINVQELPLSRKCLIENLLTGETNEN